jgi:hypothetical protein
VLEVAVQVVQHLALQDHLVQLVAIQLLALLPLMEVLAEVDTAVLLEDLLLLVMGFLKW